ncbi:ABC transporter substrate-binding protein [Novosphingobium lentum]|uniref:ABC transporter substrate-binding protein n=1 Tax=Novosphingobium lentum TaxID=145287 RepID=UPI001FE173C6|nr:ABC transporter substrate-binding protein [Novosphingobium lentum]
MARYPRLLMSLGAALALAACGRGNGGALPVSVIGDAADVRAGGSRLGPAAQLLRNATVEGLVGFDSEGRVVPAIADRWIVTDDGQSYIFRLRDGTWPDGTPITAESAAGALRRALGALRGTALGLDLADVEDVRTMAGRVVEIDLKSQMPDLLTLLAQPELGLPYKGHATGPMAQRRDSAILQLTLIPPEKRGLPAQAAFEQHVRALLVRFESSRAAVGRFNDGDVDVVLGGRIDSLPLAGITSLSRGNVQLDPVIGLFGLLVENDGGFFADPSNREALGMAIDRDALIGAFNVGGWHPTTRIVSPDVDGDLGTIGERWTAMSMVERRAVAAARVARWKAGGQQVQQLRVAMPGGPGSRLVLARLTEDFAAIGLGVREVPEGAPADLRLIDSVARYGRATWFLNQLGCGAGRVPCSPTGDARMAEARATSDPQQRAALLAEAEAEITAANFYIPIARPLRWSMVRARVSGFAPNPWGWHPLPPMAVIPR